MSKRPIDRFLNGIETAGNKLPDPAILFVIALVLVWILSSQRHSPACLVVSAPT